MASKHPTAPWYGASETTQASLMLKSLQEEISAPTTAAQEVKFRLPTQEEISTVPLKPTVVEEPPEESLLYTVDVEEGDEVVISLNLAPEEEQKLLGDMWRRRRIFPYLTLPVQWLIQRLVLLVIPGSMSMPVTFKEQWSPATLRVVVHRRN